MSTPVFADDTWWLIFTEGGYRSKWLPFLKSNFSHVIAVKEEQEGWIMLNPCRERTEITYKRKHDYPSAYCFGGESDTILRVQVQTQRGHTRGRFTFVSCVEVIKSTLGISAAVYTPYQLYRYIKDEQPN